MASRVGFKFGGNPHEATKGSKNAGQTTGGVTGTSDNADDRFQNYAVNPDFSTIGAPPSYKNRSTRSTHTPTPKGFFTGLGGAIRPYLPFGNKSLTGILTNKISNLTSKWGSGWNPKMGPRIDMGYNPNRVNPFGDPDRGGQGIIPMAPFLYDNYYAGVGEDLYDDDETVTEVDDFVQRFRLADPYRQDLYKGVEDTPITYT